MRSRDVDCLIVQSPFFDKGVPGHQDKFIVVEGLLSICTFLESRGYHTDLFCVDELFKDVPGFKFAYKRNEFSEEEVIKRIRESGPKVIGVSALTPQYVSALRVMELCRKACPDAVIVIGGPHVTYTDKKVFEDSSAVDVVVRGEGEWTMLEIMECVKGGRSFDGVAGITLRKNGKIIRNPERPFGDLTEIPPLDFTKVDLDYWNRTSYYMTNTRGCRFNCSYCVESKFWGHCVRARTVDAAMSELRYLTENTIADIRLVGSAFNEHEGFFLELCEQMQDLEFGERDVPALVGAMNLPEEHLKVMKKAGVKRLMMAVEHVSPEILKRMRKPLSFETVLEKCKLALNYELPVETFWILGHPGETEQTAKMNMEAMVYMWEHGLNDRQKVYQFAPYPGLPMLENPEKEGFKFRDTDPTKLNRYDSPIELTTIPYERMQEIFREAIQIQQGWFNFDRKINNIIGSLKKPKNNMESLC